MQQFCGTNNKISIYFIYYAYIKLQQPIGISII